MILDFEDQLTIACLASHMKLNNLTVGVTSGCWDLTHCYHLKYWKKCKRFCDILVVGVDDDFLVKSFKGDTKPIFYEDHRLELVNQSQYVSAAFIMHKIKDLETMIRMLKADYLFKNQAFNNVTFEVLGAKYAELIIVDDIEELKSTGEFIDKIHKGKYEKTTGET